MARHRDMSKAHARLEGEGWHIEYHKETLINSNEKQKKKQ